MSRRGAGFHITGWMAFALLPVAVPVILFLKLFRIGQSVDRSADVIRDFTQGSGGDWDWDDFICVPIKAGELEAIRAEAAMVELPASPSGIDELRKLLLKAEALARTSHDTA